MEGPSLVIACEELKPFLNRKIKLAEGTAKIAVPKLSGDQLKKAQSWGKHLILSFSSQTLRIHFLMFGSYRINQPRENRIPKLQLNYGNDTIYFYSCAVKELPLDWRSEYDWSVDLMSKRWDPQRCRKTLRLKKDTMVCDALMDQDIFSGLGNIMKNEILFNRRLNPETKVGSLSAGKLSSLVTECENYAWKFYDWKKKNVLKRNWQIMRKKVCPNCAGKITKKPTGRLKRLSHFCKNCQPLQTAK